MTSAALTKEFRHSFDVSELAKAPEGQDSLVIERCLAALCFSLPNIHSLQFAVHASPTVRID